MIVDVNVFNNVFTFTCVNTCHGKRKKEKSNPRLSNKIVKYTQQLFT